jgi:hypothetical protein
MLSILSFAHVLFREPASTPGSSPGAGFRRNMRYRRVPLIWGFCSSVSDAWKPSSGARSVTTA